VKRTVPILSFVLLVPVFELACFRLPIMDWFWLHVYLVLAVIIVGAVSCIFRRSRSIAYLVLSDGVIGALAGICTYLLYPFFESASSPASSTIEGLAQALAHALSPIFYAGIAMAFGLFLGWLPAWLYLRSHNVA
jgi:hypothetical protein